MTWCVSSCSEFLGCMSFGVKHLIARTAHRDVEGWYYLLSENLGHRKHLVASMTAKPHSDNSQPHSGSSQSHSDSGKPLSDVQVTSSAGASSIPNVNARVSKMEAISVSVPLILYKHFYTILLNKYSCNYSSWYYFFHSVLEQVNLTWIITLSQFNSAL